MGDSVMRSSLVIISLCVRVSLAPYFSIRIDGRFPQVFQSQPLAVIDQGDGLHDLPQLGGQ
uniref:Uncharacterized protein n=1 Tax=Anguilla anguilla TaxID=7936 RepID=A0A0E9VN44_ANGAN